MKYNKYLSSKEESVAEEGETEMLVLVLLLFQKPAGLRA